jgi:hypothetical protein
MKHIQGVPIIPRQCSGVLDNKTWKKSFHNHMSGNEWFLSLTERLFSTINILVM